MALKGTPYGALPVYSGRYGLGSKDTVPADIFAVYKNAETGAKERFTLSIHDDVTGLSLEREEAPDTQAKGTTACKFWGLGADGTVGAKKTPSRSLVTILTNMFRVTSTMTPRSPAA